MPISAAVAAGLAGAVAPGVLSAASDLWANHQARKFSREMYQRTRDDNIRFWEMQNRYNAPIAQMQRFEEAGLNPNLIYGQGSAGNAGSIPTPEVQPVNFKSTRFDKIDAMGLALGEADLKIKQAQANNLNEQTGVIVQDRQLRALQAERAGFDLAFQKDVRDFQFDAHREKVRQTKAVTDISLNRDAREAALNSSNLQEALERMLSMREQRKNTVLDRSKTYSDIRRNDAETARARQHVELMAKDGTLRDIEIQLRKEGINPNDPAWQRWLVKLLQEAYSVGSDPYPIEGYRPGSKF